MHRSFLERVEELKYFGTTVTNQNSIQEEIKSRLISGNACYHSLQNFLSCCLLSKNLKIKTWNYNYCVLFCVAAKLGRSHGGRKIG